MAAACAASRASPSASPVLRPLAGRVAAGRLAPFLLLCWTLWTWNDDLIAVNGASDGSVGSAVLSATPPPPPPPPPPRSHYVSARDCVWEPLTEPGRHVSMSCNVGVLRADNRPTNFSQASPPDLAELTVVCDRSLAATSRLPAGAFARFHQLVALRIEGCQLEELTKEGLEGLGVLQRLTVNAFRSAFRVGPLRVAADALIASAATLESLDLSGNRIEELPPRLLCATPRLESLNVSNNEIRDVNGFGFGGTAGGGNHDGVSGSSSDRCALAGVRRLDASANRLSVLAAGGFASLTGLRELGLARNDIHRVEESALVGLPALASLDLSHNSIVALPVAFFSPCLNLTRLRVRNNSLTALPPALLTRLVHLRELDLAHNQLTAGWLASDGLGELRQLLLLDLSHNKITRIGPGVLGHLEQLRSLNLDNNLIETIDEGAFSTLCFLETLSLKDNRLRQLLADTLSGLRVLSVLALDFNRIKFVEPDAFSRTPSLQKLSLANNALPSVPEAIRSLQLLRLLDLSYNKIDDIKNAAFQELSRLSDLNLMGNRIGNLTKGNFRSLPALRVLNLASNRIQAIDQNTFGDIDELNYLRLDANALDDIDSYFNNLQDLKMLNISANRIHWFDYAHVPNGLQWLDVHANQIDLLGDYFNIGKGMKLRTLDASFNQITDLNASSLPYGIERVNLHNNLLEHIDPFTFSDKPNLTRVDLTRNRLRTLDPDSLFLGSSSSELTSRQRTPPDFSVGDNPFLCDCQLDWLRSIMQRSAYSSSPPPPPLPPAAAAIASANVRVRRYPRIVDSASVMCTVRMPRGKERVVPMLYADAAAQFMCHSVRAYCLAGCECCGVADCRCEQRCPVGCNCYFSNRHMQPSVTGAPFVVVDCSSKRPAAYVPIELPPFSWSAYLDGNNITVLPANAFSGSRALRLLYLNASNVASIERNAFRRFDSLRVLHLEDNELTVLHGFEFEHMFALKELHLSSNRLEQIGDLTFNGLDQLEMLSLDDNRLVTVALWSVFRRVPRLAALWLADNRWPCDCELSRQLTDMLQLKRRAGVVLRDLDRLDCALSNATQIAYQSWEANAADCSKRFVSQAATYTTQALYNSYNNNNNNINIDSINNGGTTSNDSDRPSKSMEELLFVLIFLALFVTAVLVVGAVTMSYKQDIGDCFHHHHHDQRHDGWARRLVCAISSRFPGGDGRAGADKAFDVFVSFSRRDELFVAQSIVPELERSDWDGWPARRLCLHYRDLPMPGCGGGYLSHGVQEAIEASRATLVVLTEHFLKSECCRFEFKHAHELAVRRARKLSPAAAHVAAGRRHRLVVVLVGRLHYPDLDPDLRQWLKDSRVLHWGEKRFWNRLQHSLPLRPAFRGRRAAVAAGQAGRLTPAAVCAPPTSLVGQTDLGAFGIIEPYATGYRTPVRAAESTAGGAGGHPTSRAVGGPTASHTDNASIYAPPPRLARAEAGALTVAAAERLCRFRTLCSLDSGPAALDRVQRHVFTAADSTCDVRREPAVVGRPLSTVAMMAFHPPAGHASYAEGQLYAVGAPSDEYAYSVASTTAGTTSTKTCSNSGGSSSGAATYEYI